MQVSVRHILAGSVAALSLAAALSSEAQTACCASVSRPKPPAPSGCCANPGVQVNIPASRISGVSVNAPGVSITAPAIAVGVSSASSSAAAGASVSASSGASGASFGGVQGFSAGGGYYGGGYGYAGGYEGGGVDSGGLGAIEIAGEGAAVETETIAAVSSTAPQTATSTGKIMASGLRPVMASCISDETKRNGAIGVYAQTEVDPDYDGELYRCASGQRMAAWLGAMKSGRADFAAADAFSCRVGDAIWHAPGGRLSCKPASTATATAKAGAADELLGTHTLSGVRLIMVSPAAAAAMSAPAQATEAPPSAKAAGRTEIKGALDLSGGVGGEAW